jgi:hypothetical protein
MLLRELLRAISEPVCLRFRLWMFRATPKDLRWQFVYSLEHDERY